MMQPALCDVGSRLAGPAHSAASAKEAIRAMEAEKQERLDREEGTGSGSLRSASRDRDVRPRERSERGRSDPLTLLSMTACFCSLTWHRGCGNEVVGTGGACTVVCAAAAHSIASCIHAVCEPSWGSLPQGLPGTAVKDFSICFLLLCPTAQVHPVFDTVARREPFCRYSLACM